MKTIKVIQDPWEMSNNTPQEIAQLGSTALMGDALHTALTTHANQVMSQKLEQIEDYVKDMLNEGN